MSKSNPYKVRADEVRLDRYAQCWYRTLDLTTKERRELDEALDDLTIPAKVIVEVLGVHISTQGVQRHRKGLCTCPR